MRISNKAVRQSLRHKTSFRIWTRDLYIPCLASWAMLTDIALFSYGLVYNIRRGQELPVSLVVPA